jgi:flavin-dependent dehydrogenase
MTQPSTLLYDAIVVGARPAGSATAMLLARAGLRVLVVDRSRYGSDTLSTHGLLRGGVVQLARWGLLDHIIEAGTPPVRNTAFHYGDVRVDVPIKPGAGFDALYAPRRTVLDPMLVDAARDAGVEFRFGVTVTALRRDDHGRVTGVVGHDEARRPFAAGARITVGADGMNSNVARLTGAPVERAGIHGAGIIYGYWDGSAVADYELFYRPGVTAGAFPTNDGQVCVFAGTAARRLRSGARGDVAGTYARLLRAAAPEMLEATAEAGPPQRLRFFAGRLGYLRRAYGPGWALVGDAGYFKDPITSHGITDALRDAELLARAIIAAATGDCSERFALADYQDTRDRLSRQLFVTTDAIASFAWDLNQIPVLLVQLSEAMRDEVRWLTELEPFSTNGSEGALTRRRRPDDATGSPGSASEPKPRNSAAGPTVMGDGTGGPVTRDFAHTMRVPVVRVGTPPQDVGHHHDAHSALAQCVEQLSGTWKQLDATERRQAHGVDHGPPSALRRAAYGRP